MLSQLRSVELVGDIVLSAEVCVKSEWRQEAGGPGVAGPVVSLTAGAHDSIMETVGGCGVNGAPSSWCSTWTSCVPIRLRTGEL